jgi:GGDEF domain-containing protein
MARTVTASPLAGRLKSAFTRYENSHDAQTGMPGSFVFIDRCVMAQRMTRRDRAGFGIGILIVENLDEVANLLGEDIADLAVRDLAAHLTGAFRAGDTVARLAPDTFACVLPRSQSLTTTKFVLDTAANGAMERLATKGVVLGLRVGVAYSDVATGEAVQDVVARAAQDAERR